MTKVKVAEDVYWVGVEDWDLRNFHGYRTPHGTTYNAYLIIDEKIALVDTVKRTFAHELLEKIREIVEPERIDYVISNHAEVDHSGSLPQIMAAAKNAKLVVSQRGKPALERHYYAKWPFVAVKDNDTLKLGKRTLRFFEIPMLHWPDSMVTYSEPDCILYSSDGFGQHLATSKRFDDEVNPGLLMYEATNYYANILMPYSKIALRVLEKLKPLKINIIATAHGVIWRSDPNRIVQAYLRWAKGEAKRKALVIYDTMWGSTERMARAIVDGIASEGVEVRLYNLTKSDMTDIMGEILDSKAIVVGSSTLNVGILPNVGAFLTYLKGLKPIGKLGAAFGSYGWGGGAISQVKEELAKAGVQLLEEDLGVKYVPSEEELKRCVEFGKAIARKVKE